MNGPYARLHHEILQAQAGTSAPLRVYLTRRLPDRDVALSAERLFGHYHLEQTTLRNGILLYVNLRTRRFAVARDAGADAALGMEYWRELSQCLRDDLLSTHHELALRMAVRTLGISLARLFPADDNGVE
ncbi:MAG TPA: TPM domain-containing protein [Bdellovibrionota bacterium]|jgi:uncharacterized membrane protein|nr:TPM domain-containing protein [Bdellovibrionota bacterium]